MPQQFNVFLSRKSADAALAKELYLFLSDKGLTVFDAQESLPQMGISEYQEAIDEALDSCDHMIVVGSKLEHLNAPWVKAEWRSFINDKRADLKSGNLLTVVEGEISPHNLPPSLRSFEVIKYSRDNFERIYTYVKDKKRKETLLLGNVTLPDTPLLIKDEPILSEHATPRLTSEEEIAIQQSRVEQKLAEERISTLPDTKQNVGAGDTQITQAGANIAENTEQWKQVELPEYTKQAPSPPQQLGNNATKLVQPVPSEIKDRPLQTKQTVAKADKKPNNYSWLIIYGIFMICIVIAIIIGNMGGVESVGTVPVTTTGTAPTEPAPEPTPAPAATTEPAVQPASEPSPSVKPSASTSEKKNKPEMAAVATWTKHDERMMASSDFSCSNIYFDYMGAKLRPESVTTLENVVEFLNQYPNLKVSVLGSHDSLEHIEDKTIATKRAQNVGDYIEKSGINNERISRRIFPSHSPVMFSSINGRDNPESRQINRIVAIVIRTPNNEIIYHSCLPGNIQQQIAKYGYH